MLATLATRRNSYSERQQAPLPTLDHDQDQAASSTSCFGLPAADGDEHPVAVDRVVDVGPARSPLLRRIPRPWKRSPAITAARRPGSTRATAADSLRGRDVVAGGRWRGRRRGPPPRNGRAWPRSRAPRAPRRRWPRRFRGRPPRRRPEPGGTGRAQVLAGYRRTMELGEVSRRRNAPELGSAGVRADGGLHAAARGRGQAGVSAGIRPPASSVGAKPDLVAGPDRTQPRTQRVPFRFPDGLARGEGPRSAGPVLARPRDDERELVDPHNISGRTRRPPPITYAPVCRARGALYPLILTVTIRPPSMYLELFDLFTLKVTGKEQETPPAQP